MPIPIEKAVKEGKQREVTVKMRKDEIIQMLSKNAYTVEELAKHFGVDKNRVYTRISMLRRKGVNIQSAVVDGKTYYFIPPEQKDQQKQSQKK